MAEQPYVVHDQLRADFASRLSVWVFVDALNGWLIVAIREAAS